MPPKTNTAGPTATSPALADASAAAVPPDTTGTTRLDSDVTKPSVTAPGDGPADTTDPTERASSVPPQPGAEALLVGTVNAVLPVPSAAPGRTSSSKSKARIETFTAVRPDGTEVTVTRNIETGESKVSG